MVVGDFNNDGFLDFVVGGGSKLQLFLGKGNGTFQPPVNFDALATVSTMVAGDFNGDGNLDLAVLSERRPFVDALNILLGDGRGGFPTRVRYGGLRGPSRVLAAADFNNDGNLDVCLVEGLVKQESRIG
jgi:hypothetical protein